VNIFDEDDYKKILRALVKEKSDSKRGFYRKMAEYLGVNPSLISQVVSGSRDFTEEQTVSICEFLGLPKLESRYLLTLVQVARAGSVQLKSYHLETLTAIKIQATNLSERVSKTRSLSDAEKAKFYSSWVYSAIQLCSTLDKPMRFKDVCSKFNLPPSDAQRIIGFLQEIGLIIDDRGVYKPGPSDTHLEKASPYISNLHRNWRLKAMQLADAIRDEELMYTCNFSVSRKDFATIREIFFKTIQDFLDTAQKSPAEEIAQFNLDLFWVR
jgi:uncharacterized protein (TIGR02147 family)